MSARSLAGRFRGIGAGLAFATVASSACAEPCARDLPWSRLPETAREFVRPIPLVLSAASVVPLATMAPSGVDHRARVFAERELGGTYDLEPVSVPAPFVLVGATALGYGIGVVSDACSAQRVQAAMLQAMALSFGSVVLLKLTTGRTFPTGGQDPRAPDRLEHPEYARSFEPFVLRDSAWPSGHTAVMVAAASAFRASLPAAGVWRFAGYPLAAAVAGGMWLGMHHWASDILSGALLGEAIGGSVGRAFSRSGLPEPAAVGFVPAPGGGMVFIARVF